jgi:hypothetical protein
VGEADLKRKLGDPPPIQTSPGLGYAIVTTDVR